MTRFHELVEPLNLQAVSVRVGTGNATSAGSLSLVTGSVQDVYVPWDCDLVRVTATINKDANQTVTLAITDNDGNNCCDIEFGSGITAAGIGISGAQDVSGSNLTNVGFAEGDYITVDLSGLTSSTNTTACGVDVGVTLVFDVGHDG